jgi:hypothetical protein
MRDEVERLRDQYQFFHWHLAFPDVFEVTSWESGEEENLGPGWAGGFDVVLGNPPWEKINLKDEEFFAQSYPEIANAPNKSKRKKLIENLKAKDPEEYIRYEQAQRQQDGLSLLFREGGLFPLTGVSRINLYSVFAELSLRNLSPHGRLGLVIASGLATDDNNKAFFEVLIENNQLFSVWDFENREGIFPGIHKSYKFCLFIAGGKHTHNPEADFAFYLTQVEHLGEKDRHFMLTPTELLLINPNTKTCPTFRNNSEAELTKKIYKSVKAWCLHEPDEGWPGIPRTPFNMSNDSGHFSVKSDLLKSGLTLRNSGCIEAENQVLLPLYESKLIHQFTHRFSTFAESSEEEIRKGNSVELQNAQLTNPECLTESRYWVDRKLQNERFSGRWFLVYRKISHPTNERTAIASLIPGYPCGDSLILIDNLSASNAGLFCSVINSFIYDYVARQKIPGSNFNQWIWKQLPVLSPFQLSKEGRWLSQEPIYWAMTRVLELTYTAWDLQPFAQDCGYEVPPFQWDEDRRFLLCCELDAAYFHLYGIQRDDVDYIMDTFPIVKRKDEKAHGHYRTKDTILQIYDAMATAIASGQPYQTLLDPPPADPRVAHPARE